MRLIENPMMVTRRQIRFPRSKKARIRNKWYRDKRNWITEPDEHCYMISRDTLVCHPATARKIREMIHQQERTTFTATHHQALPFLPLSSLS
jgi:hypothetical protein